ncbi:MAG: phosphatase PAP2 family protein [Eubacterium sp.]|nr:phosphatase PAP2 family protein [Eubacterium sp.]
MKRKMSRSNMIILGISIVFHLMTYFGTRIFTKELYHYDMTTKIDNYIPVLPWTIIIYWGCYLYWLINYLLGFTQDEMEARHFILADLFAKVVCFFCFVCIPTTNVRPIVMNTDIFNRGLLFLYKLDSADNLFPSIHCLTSCFSIIAIRRQSSVPKWYKVLSFIITLFVFVSVLTLKQHVIADVIGAIVLAEFSYWITGLKKNRATVMQKKPAIKSFVENVPLDRT